MSKILITGGGGFIGQKVARKLANTPIAGESENAVTLFDLLFPEDCAPHDRRVTGSLTDNQAIESAIADRPQIIIHLASVVSGEAELNFDKGWQTNLFATWRLLETIRGESERGDYVPRFIYASSVAAFGAPFPEVIDDDFVCTPHSSYGSQKVSCEMMINDFSRKGFINGVSLRLPTISVRSGKPNKAATSFFSGIIREPLNGLEAILPVSDKSRHIHASPRAAASYFVHAAKLDLSKLNGRTALTMPSLSCTVEEQIEALRAAAGNNVVKRIRFEEDKLIAGLVKNWPQRFSTKRADQLGFWSESSYDEIVKVYLEDDFTGTLASA